MCHCELFIDEAIPRKQKIASRKPLAMTQDLIARHNEQRGQFEAFELRSQTLRVAEPVHIDPLLPAGHDVDR